MCLFELHVVRLLAVMMICIVSTTVTMCMIINVRQGFCLPASCGGGGSSPSTNWFIRRGFTECLESISSTLANPDFWPRNIVKRGVCYRKVCPSVRYSRESRPNGSAYRNTLHTVRQREVFSSLRTKFTHPECRGSPPASMLKRAHIDGETTSSLKPSLHYR